MKTEDALRSVAGDVVSALSPVSVFEANGIAPDSWQREALSSTSPRLAVLAGRQAGKTVSAAALALHHALYRPDALVLLISPSQRQSSEVLRTIKRLFQPYADRFPLAQEAALALVFRRGARIVSLPGDATTIRTYSPTFILLDEAAFIKDPTYAAVLPMAAVTRARIVALSTPFRPVGWLFNEWAAGDWHRVRVTSGMNPRIRPEDLEAQRIALGDTAFRREHLAEFVDDDVSTENLVFRPGSAMEEMLDRAFGLDVPPLEAPR